MAVYKEYIIFVTFWSGMYYWDLIMEKLQTPNKRHSIKKTDQRAKTLNAVCSKDILGQLIKLECEHNQKSILVIINFLKSETVWLESKLLLFLGQVSQGVPLEQSWVLLVEQDIPTSVNYPVTLLSMNIVYHKTLFFVKKSSYIIKWGNVKTASEFLSLNTRPLSFVIF